MASSDKISAAHLYAYLSCPHRVHLDAFGDPEGRDPVSPFVQMLWERGTAYEISVVEGLDGKFVDLSALWGDAKEAATREAIAGGAGLIYSGRLSAENFVGEPDLLRREGEGYAPIDIKSGAWGEGDEGDEDAKPKKSYGVQIAAYVDILTRLDLAAGRYGYIFDVHGTEKRYELDVPLGSRTPSLWEVYLESRLAVEQLLAGGPSLPAACSACSLCVWRTACLEQLQASRDLTLLPELGRSKRDLLMDQFPSVDVLASSDVEPFCRGSKTDIAGMGAGTLRKFKARAMLMATEDAQPYLTQPVVWPTSRVELFFDLETDPMRDLVYLHGFVIREDGNSGGERFVAHFAAGVTAQAERDAFAAAMDVLRSYPDAAVIHYSKFERTQYRKLQLKYPEVASAGEIEALFVRPRALDLYFDAVRSSSEWPTMNKSIKTLAKFCGFAWRDADPSGAASIEWFDEFVRNGDPRVRQRILDYNEDDCVAMRVVMDAMKKFEVR